MSVNSQVLPSIALQQGAVTALFGNINDSTKQATGGVAE